MAPAALAPSCAAPGALDAAGVIARLEEAGMSLMSLRVGSGRPNGYHCGLPVPVRDAHEAYGWEPEPVQPAVPSAAAIDRMDEAWGWLSLIPTDRYVLRRIVAARALVYPLTERHVHSWRGVGRSIGACHQAARNWHAQGIQIIVTGLCSEAR
jgi:hypothetical protein